MIIPDEHLRKYLHHPKGLILKGKSLSEYLSNSKERAFVTIGDLVTKIYIEHTHRIPLLAVIDGRTVRGKIDQEWVTYITSLYENVFKTLSKPGTLPLERFLEDLWEVKLHFISKDPSLIIIDGEEDLFVLALPMILYKVTGYRIMYGQPGMGAVIIEDPLSLFLVASNIFPFNYIKLQGSSE